MTSRRPATPPKTNAETSAAVVLIHGSNEYLVSQRARELVTLWCPPDRQVFGLEIVEGRADSAAAAAAAVGQCLAALLTPDFLGNGKIVWLRDVNFLSDSVVGKAADAKAAVERLVAVFDATLPEGNRLVLSAGDVDRRRAFYRKCSDKGKVEEYQVAERSYEQDRQAKPYVLEVFRKAGIPVDEAAASLIVERVGADFRILASEIEKLIVYVGSARRVSREDVEEIVGASRDALAWDLADAVGDRDLDRALRVLGRLLFQGESPFGLMAVLHGRARDLGVYREAIDKGWLKKARGGRGDEYAWGAVPEAVERCYAMNEKKDPRRTHPYRVSLLARQAAHHSRAEVKRVQRVLVETHADLVSSRIPPKTLLELAVVKMLS